MQETARKLQQLSFAELNRKYRQEFDDCRPSPYRDRLFREWGKMLAEKAGEVQWM